MSEEKLMLKAEHIHKKFGELVAVSDVSMQIKKGEVHSLIGSNGAGKTTFMDIIAHRLTPTSGQIWFDGKEITKAKPEMLPRLGMCKCFQITKLFMNLTVFQNVRIALISKKKLTYNFWPRNDSFLREEVEKILEVVGIPHLKDQTVAYLSYGDPRRERV